MSNPVNVLYEFGEFRLEPAERLLRHKGTAVPLTPKAFETLLVLVQRSGRLVEKDELLKEVWADTYVEEANLARLIWTLRKALGDEDRQHRFIETIPKRGYRFVAPVTELPADEAVDVIVQRRVRARIVTESEVSAQPKTASVGNRKPLLFVSVGVGVILLAVVAVLLARNANRTPSVERIESIAVLPFSNSDPELEYLSEGITENIINRLSHASNLKMIARSSVYRYKGRQVDPNQAGKELGVQAVLIGQVALANGNVSISTELVNVRDGRRLWGDRYERTIDDLRFFQGELAQNIANALQLQLSGEKQTRLDRNHTRDSEAYQLYLKGRHFWNKRTTESMQKGLEFFQQAIAKDPNYALAYSGLADCYSVLSQFGAIPPNEAMPKAKAAALEALRIDETLAEAHASLAVINQLYDWNWSAAEKEFKRAIELNPNHATAHHWYAMYLSAVGKHEEALLHIRQAKELDPVSSIINTNEGWILFCARQYDRAAEQLRSTIELEPNFANAHYKLALVYEAQGRYDEAVEEYLKAEVLSGTNEKQVERLKTAYAKSGWRGFCEAELQELKDESKSGYVLPKYFVLSHLQLGDTEQAFKWFEAAYKERAELLIYLKVDPRFDRIRSDPRFQDLLRRVMP